MAVLRPFFALRPPSDHAELVAAPPYDVVDVAEAVEYAKGNPDCFLHISRPEIDLGPDADPHGDFTYLAGRRTLEDFVQRGMLLLDEKPSYSVYRQRTDQVCQTGFVGCASVDDYLQGVIKIHEHTRPDKEEDRVRHIDTLGAHDEPVFCLFPPDDELAAVLDRVVLGKPDVHFEDPHGVTHTLWVVSEPAELARIEAAFTRVPHLYVADGHHRSAAAARVRDLRQARNGSAGEAEVFLTVVFPTDQVAVMPYNRVVADLAGRSPAELLAALRADFEVEPVDGAVKPERRRVFGMYLDGRWYRLTARAHLDGGVPSGVDGAVPGGAEAVVAGLDVAVLQERVLEPLLGIGNPRTDPRIGFVGGVRGTAELVRRVDSGSAALAFSLFPTSVAELMAVADSGAVMPPKSTWFEPKLRSGLFLHAFEPVSRPLSSLTR